MVAPNPRDPQVGDKVYSLERKRQSYQPNGEIHNVDYDHEAVIVKYFGRILDTGDSTPDYQEYGLSTFSGTWDDAFFGGSWILGEE